MEQNKITKKKLILIILFTVLLLGGIATAIAVPLALNSGDGERTITLSFDKSTAYFTGKTPLMAIGGDFPVADDSIETATVILKSDAAIKMQLKIVYESETAEIPCLMAQVNSGGPVAVHSGAVLYTSGADETEARLSVTFYLSKEASVASMNKALSFRLELTGAEA